VRVPVLEPADGDAPPIEAPAAADCVDRVDRGPAALFQAVQRVIALAARLNGDAFLDAEVARLAIIEAKPEVSTLAGKSRKTPTAPPKIT